MKPRGKPFIPNDPRGCKTGRPKGALKKIRWYNLQDLQDEAFKTLDEIDDPKLRIAYIMHKESLLFPKLNSAPKTPEESADKVSKQNLDAQLKEVENGSES